MVQMECRHRWKKLEGEKMGDSGTEIRECISCGMVERYSYVIQDDGIIKGNHTILEGPKQKDNC